MNTEYMTGSRIDNTYIARVGVMYNPNKFISLSANYRYYDNASNLAGASFSQNVIDFSVGVRY